MNQQNYYQEDLAYIHDQGYSDLSVLASDLLAERLKKKHIHSGLITDLGCGSGKLLKKMADRGYETIGVDISEDILVLGQKHAPTTKFIKGSIWDYELEKCVGITAIGEIITYRFDDNNSDENVIKLFQNIYNSLEQNGLFIFDYLEPNIIENGDHLVKVAREENWTMVVEYFEDKQNHYFTRDITVFKKMQEDVYRKSREVHEVRLFPSSFITESLENIGFRVEEQDHYQGRKLRNRHKAIIATK